MGLPVEIPGLSTILPEVPDGKVAIVEGGADGAKAFFARTLARTALQNGRRVTYLTSRDGPEVMAEIDRGRTPGGDRHGLLRVEELDALTDASAADAIDGLLAIDSFSFLTLDFSPSALATLLRSLRGRCARNGLCVVLATDRGMFDLRSEAITVHLSDGLIQFQSKEGPEGIVRYLRIPKWPTGTLTDRNIYYEFDGHRLAIDLRRRVL
jgi:KaiC/GvpD/RAD55 family RecA-like ATPase